MTLSPLLITAVDMAAYVTVSQTMIPAQLDTFIRAAQDTDLRQLLGDSFYTALLANQSNYSDLINGVVYNDGTNDVRFDGVKPVIVYYTWARIIARGNTQHTPFNFVEKNSPWQQGVSSSTLKAEVEQARSDAAKYAEAMVTFLNWMKGTGASAYQVWPGNTVTRRPRIRVQKIGD
jgi:hypothetical protein